jgi:hypothetical protein
MDDGRPAIHALSRYVIANGKVMMHGDAILRRPEAEYFRPATWRGPVGIPRARAAFSDWCQKYGI